MTEQKKNNILDVVALHSAKLHEAGEALQLLRQAMYSMGADEAFQDILSSENPMSQLFATEFIENMLYQPLRDAEKHIREAQSSVSSFVRILNNAYAVSKHRGKNHD